MDPTFYFSEEINDSVLNFMFSWFLHYLGSFEFISFFFFFFYLKKKYFGIASLCLHIVIFLKRLVTLELSVHAEE